MLSVNHCILHLKHGYIVNVNDLTNPVSFSDLYHTSCIRIHMSVAYCDVPLCVCVLKVPGLIAAVWGVVVFKEVKVSV